MPKAKRKAAKVEPKAFLDLLFKKMEELDEIDGFDRYKLQDIDKVGKDISKVHFDFENCEFGPFPSMDDSTNGVRTMYVQGGYLSFLGVTAGGDWEFPVYFIIYLDQDGKTFRAYIPKEGNVWNHKTKQALGNDEDKDAEFLKAYCKKNKIDFDEDHQFFSDDGDIMLNEARMRNDIYNRIEVVPS